MFLYFQKIPVLHRDAQPRYTCIVNPGLMHHAPNARLAYAPMHDEVHGVE